MYRYALADSEEVRGVRPHPQDAVKPFDTPTAIAMIESELGAGPARVHFGTRVGTRVESAAQILRLQPKYNNLISPVIGFQFRMRPYRCWPVGCWRQLPWPKCVMCM